MKMLVYSALDGAAEEAGLQVGDYVLAVNGTDVTSIPHSEAADLARQGRLDSDNIIRHYYSFLKS